MPRQPLSLRDQIGAAMGPAPPSNAANMRQQYLGGIGAARPTPQMAQPTGMGAARPPMSPPPQVPPGPQPMQNPGAPNVNPGAIGVIQPRVQQPMAPPGQAPGMQAQQAMQGLQAASGAPPSSMGMAGGQSGMAGAAPPPQGGMGDPMQRQAMANALRVGGNTGMRPQ